ncbi:MAG: ABC transporter permease, partial [Nitrosopumilus sp. (ex Thoosa mismalolli)]|nr:ABC transporter permease [Nitrosopumilus sp. (ex Thoosa mismalolli)]
MSSVSPQEIKQEFIRSKIGIAGISILVILVSISIIAITIIPVETFQEWNNPGNWISYPKVAVPVWVNYLQSEKIPEHLILDSPIISNNVQGEIIQSSHQFTVNYQYDDFPNDFIYEFTSSYKNSPLIQMSVLKPDGITLNLVSSSLPYSENLAIHQERIFSTDEMIKKNLFLQSDFYGFSIENLSSEDIIFSQSEQNIPLKGKYVFQINAVSIDSEIELTESKLIVGGKAFGVMGTDELRRDLAIGLLWGTPLALFIGLVVAIASVIMGLLYGVYAGFKGKKTDEVMMRFNDVIYALPALPFLIILSVTISNSIFLMVGFLMIFGWVGIAKVSRSMSLQIKTRGYVDAANMMGQKNSKIILKHIIPQLLPYAFASIAISVPAAITT